MRHPFLEGVATGLAERRIATVRYQFPSMERGGRLPDQPRTAEKTVRAAVAATIAIAPDLPLFAGGKSFGSRMTSQAQAELPLPSVRGLFFLGFPLHPANIVSSKRALHLSRIFVPMLFLQGTRDAMADLPTLTPVVQGLGAVATLTTVEGADHSFHVPKSSRRSDADAMADVLDALVEWIAGVLRRGHDDPT